jgi:hypothetical protein
LTPGPAYQATTELRSAYVDVQPDGKVKGNIRMVLTGAFALRWREFALNNDEDALKQQFTALLQAEMPAGIEVKTDHFLGLNDWTTNLQAVVSVTGSIGTSAGKRVFLPATFFEATSHPFFVLDKRTQPIDLNYPYTMQDTVTIKLPPALEVEGLPKDTEFMYLQNALYRAKFTREPGMMKTQRILVIGNVLYKAEEYPQLKDFYQKVNAKDKEPAVLQLTSVVPAVAAGNSK